VNGLTDAAAREDGAIRLRAGQKICSRSVDAAKGPSTLSSKLFCTRVGGLELGGMMILALLGKLAIGLYIGKQGIESTYGAAASIVVVLIWVYYSAQIILMGAEFTHVYALRMGSLKGTAARSQAAKPAGIRPRA
jgi:hypothetical protein